MKGHVTTRVPPLRDAAASDVDAHRRMMDARSSASWMRGGAFLIAVSGTVAVLGLASQGVALVPLCLISAMFAFATISALSSALSYDLCAVAWSGRMRTP